MTQTRRRFPASFKRKSVDQSLAGTPLRHVAETLGIAESLLGRWRRQYEQQGDDAFPGNGKQRGERAELRRLCQQLAQVTRHRGVGRSLSRSTDVPAAAASLGERDGESASEPGDPHHPQRGEWDLWPSPNQARVGGHGVCMWSTPSRSTDARSRSARSLAQALAAGFQQSSCSADCPEPSGSPVHLGSRQSALGLGHDLRADGPRLAVFGCRARFLFARCRRLGDSSTHAAGPGACCSGHVARRQPKEEVLLHSDRGSQYCTYDYQALLRRHRIVPSHSRPSNCWDTQFTILLTVSPI